MQQDFRRLGFDVRMVRLQPWKVWLLAGIGGAIALTLAIVMAGLFLVLVPVELVGGLVARLLLGGKAVPVPPRRPSDAHDVIEGRYEVVDVEGDARRTGR